jgi:hypothetical protein
MNDLRYRLDRRASAIGLWFVWRLPRRLVYWCSIRLIAHATTGVRYGNTLPDDLSVMDALERWGQSNDESPY